MQLKPATLVTITAAAFIAGGIYCAKQIDSPNIKKAKRVFDAVRESLKDKTPANA